MCSLLLVFLLILCAFAQDPVFPDNSWPDAWHTWVVTNVNDGQNASVIKGQLAIFDLNNQYTCRYSQQDLVNGTGERPTDMCDYNAGYHFRLNDTSIYAKCDLRSPLNGPLQRMAWPPGFKETAKFQGTDHIAQKDCNHFIAQGLNVSGTTVQMDVWVANDTGFPCLISVFEANANPKTYISWAFDGFIDNIPPEALRCTAPQVVCNKPDWICSALPGTDQDLLGAALQWTCGQNVNCDLVDPGGPFFQPNTVLDHCNWAFNNYFQQNKALYGEQACNFNGIAKLQPPPSGSRQDNVGPEKALSWSKNLDSFLKDSFSLIYPQDLICN